MFQFQFYLVQNRLHSPTARVPHIILVSDGRLVRGKLPQTNDNEIFAFLFSEGVGRPKVAVSGTGQIGAANRITGLRYQSFTPLPLHSSPLARTDLIPSLISDRITSDLLEPSLSAMSSTNRMTFF
jgi:hypothetical protein